MKNTIIAIGLLLSLVFCKKNKNIEPTQESVKTYTGYHFRYRTNSDTINRWLTINNRYINNYTDDMDVNLYDTIMMGSSQINTIDSTFYIEFYINGKLKYSENFVYGGFTQRYVVK